MALYASSCPARSRTRAAAQAERPRRDALTSHPAGRCEVAESLGLPVAAIDAIGADPEASGLIDAALTH